MSDTRGWPQESLGPPPDRALAQHGIRGTGGAVVILVRGYMGSLASDQRPSVLQFWPHENNTF